MTNPIDRQLRSFTSADLHEQHDDIRKLMEMDEDLISKDLKGAP
jgi:hypothetical protein